MCKVFWSPDLLRLWAHIRGALVEGCQWRASATMHLPPILLLSLALSATASRAPAITTRIVHKASEEGLQMVAGREGRDGRDLKEVINKVWCNLYTYRSVGASL